MRNGWFFIFAVSATAFTFADDSTSGRLVQDLSQSGATTQESEELDAAHLSAKGFVDLDKVLERNPNNRPALSLRVSARANSGEIVAARRDLDRLIQIDPQFTGIDSLQLHIAISICDSDLEVQALRRLIKEPPSLGDKLLEETKLARISELHGDLSSAQAHWKTAAEKVPASVAPYVRHEAALFKLRHKMIKEAVDDLEALAKIESPDINLRPTVEGSLAMTYWIQGRKEDARRMFRQLNNDFKDHEFNVELQCQCALAASTLYGANPLSDANDLTDALKFAAKRMGSNPNYMNSLAPCLAFLLKKDGGEDTVSHLTVVLKSAPGNEWAQWSALFMVLNQAPGADKLSQLLPENCIPTQILRTETKTK